MANVKVFHTNGQTNGQTDKQTDQQLYAPESKIPGA